MRFVITPGRDTVNRINEFYKKEAEEYEKASPEKQEVLKDFMLYAKSI